MNKPDTWYVQKGVELADGWEWNWGRAFSYINNMNCALWGDGHLSSEPKPWHLDILAAQLVEQVLDLTFDLSISIQGASFDAPGMWVEITDMQLSDTQRFEFDAKAHYSMNLIRAIVDSKVLEGSNE